VVGENSRLDTAEQWDANKSYLLSRRGSRIRRVKRRQGNSERASEIARVSD